MDGDAETGMLTLDSWRRRRGCRPVRGGTASHERDDCPSPRGPARTGSASDLYRVVDYDGLVRPSELPLVTDPPLKPRLIGTKTTAKAELCRRILDMAIPAG